jgi:DNA-directed RNA polymerase specialized sigma24 family protein
VPSEVLDEDDLDLGVQLGLLGSDTEKREAIRDLFIRYRERLMCFLEKKRPYIPADLAATAVNNAFIELYEMACEGTLDVEKSLRPLLFTIADRRAIDEIRKNRPPLRSDDELAADIGAALQGTDIGSAWRIFCQTGDLAEEIRDEFRAFVGTLPKKQKLIASVMADDLLMSDGEISQHLREHMGIVVPVMEVKGAKQALMKKFRDILKKKGVQ